MLSQFTSLFALTLPYDSSTQPHIKMSGKIGVAIIGSG